MLNKIPAEGYRLFPKSLNVSIHAEVFVFIEIENHVIDYLAENINGFASAFISETAKRLNSPRVYFSFASLPTFCLSIATLTVKAENATRTAPANIDVFRVSWSNSDWNNNDCGSLSSFSVHRKIKTWA
jgi:hypothetical protein